MRAWLRTLRYGLGNIIAYAPVIWRDRDWDWTFLVLLLEFKLRRMAVEIGERGHHLHDKRDAAQMLQAAFLCRRLSTEDYSSERFQLAKDHKRHDALAKQDLELLCTLLRKYLRNWWD